MARFLHSVYSFTFRKNDKFLLALSWAMGLGFGGLVFRYVGSDLVSQMPLAAMCQPSIFGLLISSVLPFLFSAFAVYICVPELLFGVCFVKAFLFGYVSCGVLSAFAGAGWLVKSLMLFSDIVCSALLYGYWLRHISGIRRFSACGFGVLLAAVAGICWVDCRFISPLLRCSLL